MYNEVVIYILIIITWMHIIAITKSDITTTTSTTWYFYYYYYNLLLLCRSHTRTDYLQLLVIHRCIWMTLHELFQHWECNQNSDTESDSVMQLCVFSSQYYLRLDPSRLGFLSVGLRLCTIFFYCEFCWKCKSWTPKN